ncbi:MAG: sugar transferase, partial [Coraliomargarita sp.]|nr:sugar transferase [Coraliomargarita sp.]
MIRHQLSAQKQVFIGILFASSVILMGLLKYAFSASGFLLLNLDARIEIYLIGVIGALIYMHRDWSRLLRGSLLRAPFESILCAVRFAAIQSVTFLLIYFLLRDVTTSRSFLLWFSIIGMPVNAILITWLPSLLRRLFNRSGSVSGVLIGKGPIPEEVVNYADRCRHFGVEFCGFFGDTQRSEVDFTQLGTLSDVSEETLDLDSSPKQILFYGSNLEDPECQSALNLCYRLGIRAQVMLHGDFFSQYLLRHVVDGEAHLLTFAEEPLQNPLNRAAKRCVDVALSVLIVVFCMPLLVVVAWLFQRFQSPGPLFYKQMRHGLDRKAFPILKFRTMDFGAGSEAKQATPGDTRIYPFGRFLRHFSLDEVPQF